MKPSGIGEAALWYVLAGLLGVAFWIGVYLVF
jgi:hypothetical protein